MFQDNIKNVFLILLIIIIFTGVGFYSAYIIQDEKMTELVKKNNSTINSLNSQVSYLRNIFGDLVIQYEKLEQEMEESENTYMQKDLKYEELSEKYSQLDDSYQSLSQDYADLYSSIVLEREVFLNKTKVAENSVKLFFNNISFECPQGVVFSVNDLVNMNLTEILTGNSCKEKKVITLFWRYEEDEPDLNATLKEAYGSDEKYVKGTSSNNTLVKGDYTIRYINFTAIVDEETRYVLISTWYMADTSHQYLCVVQDNENTVVATYREMMMNWYQY